MARAYKLLSGSKGRMDGSVVTARCTYHKTETPHPSMPTLQSQRGFSLIEILISIVVLCFGVLGMVGLQAASLQANREARLQSTAVRLAEEMAELMRGNKDTALKTTNNPYLFDVNSSSSITAVTCGLPGDSSDCTTGDLVGQRDVYEWLIRTVTGTKNSSGAWLTRPELPGARVVICQDSTPYDASGLPQWACSGTGGTLVLKMGWTRANTLRGATGTDASDTSSANTGAFDKALRPAVTFTVTPGSTS